MAMTPEEKSAYLAEVNAEHNAMLDRILLASSGRTWRLDEADLKMAADQEKQRARLVTLPHAKRNGDSTEHPKDSWQQIKKDFPDVFGKADDAT